MLIQRRALWGILCVLVVCVGSVLGAFDGYYLTIGNPDGGSQETAPYFLGTMDAAGYSDWIFYGKSPDHDYSYHEILSGEWAAAIYYEGIDTEILDPNTNDREAMWLTKNFVFPDWGTNSDFHKPTDKICEAWHNTSNPVQATPLA